MLPRFLKFIVVNNSGRTLTFNNNGRINLKQWRWIVDPATGKKVETQIADDDLGFIAGSSLADGAEIVGDLEVDNSSDLQIGQQVQLEVTHDEGTLADGTFDLYIATGDASGELETDASGYASAEANDLRIVNVLVWESNGLDDELMRSTFREIA